MDTEHVEMNEKAKSAATTSFPDNGEKKKLTFPSISLQLVKEYGLLMRSNQGNILNDQISTPSSSKVLSTNDIMRIARSRILKCTSEDLDVVSILMCGSVDDDFGSSSELELALLLHASALKVYNRQFDRARRLLAMCGQPSSISRNPVQKVVFYFAEALEKRITKELGIVPLETYNGNQRSQIDVEEALTSFQPATVTCLQELPFFKICEHTAIQSILENVATARRVHLVDLGIRSGSQWTAMMKGLHGLVERSDCPLEMLKLTVIGTSKEVIEKIGKHLSSFAETMKIHFQIKILVSDLKNIEQDMLEIEEDEAVVIHSSMRLSSLLAWPDRLESVLQTIANLQPCAIVTTELEANTNASGFMERFNESVSLTSALLDCLEDTFDKENLSRVKMEEVFISQGIQNVITAEGEDRSHRHQRIEMWRAIMAMFGLVQLPLSDFTLNLAYTLVKNSPRWRSACTLISDGKYLIAGWKGTPVKSISVWKYQRS